MDGIPYGEGWNLNIPTISVSTASYNEYTEANMCTISKDASKHGNMDNATSNNMRKNFWFSPMISIPGVCHGRGVFKHIEKGAAVFVLDVFEQYIEARYYGSYWEVQLPNGVRYDFGVAQMNYAEAANVKSSRSYGDLYATVQHDSIYSNDIRNNTMPRKVVSSWYCTMICNINYPGENLVFNYEHFGCFDFFKEMSQKGIYESLPYVFKTLTSGFNDFEACNELLLTRIDGYTGQSYLGAVELEYETVFPAANITGFLDHRNPGTSRMDSLYNYRTLVNTKTGQGFANWSRYYHPSAIPFINQDVASRNNPFIAAQGYYRNPIATTTLPLPFNHSILESPRIAEVYPGAIYEIKADAVNPGRPNLLDINAYLTDPRISPPQGWIDPVNYDRMNKATVFNTFNRGIKWITNQTRPNDPKSGISAFFRLPAMGDSLTRLQIQLGPANSDCDFSRPSDKDGYGEDIFINQNTYIPSAAKSYYAYKYRGADQLMTGDPGAQSNMPNNFGIGMPWFNMLPLYDRLWNFAITEDDLITSPPFRFWKKPANYVGPTSADYTNTPTTFGNTDLNAFELKVYTKNPYMLKRVKTYVKNGDWKAGGKICVKNISMDYLVKELETFQFRNYSVGDSLLKSNRLKYQYLLEKINEQPLDGEGDPQFSRFTYSKLPANAIQNYNTDLYLAAVPEVMTSVEDELGNITEIEYYSLNDSQTHKNKRIFVATTSVCDDAVNRLTNNVTDIIPVVKKLSSTSRLGKLSYNYEYSNRCGRIITPYLTSKFGTVPINLEVGFKNVRVIAPALTTADSIANRRPYTEYVYHGPDLGGDIFYFQNVGQFQNSNDYVLYGKLRTARKFDSEGFLYEQKSNTYEFITAFGDGMSKYANALKAPDFEYQKVFSDIKPTDFTAVSDGFVGGTAGLLGVKAFMDQVHPMYKNSHFVKLISDTTTLNDKAGTISLGSVVTPTAGGSNALGLGVQNTAQNANAFLLKTLSAVVPMLETTAGVLLSSSPLEESVLQTLLSAQRSGSETLARVLLAQPALSDYSLQLLLRNTGLASDFKTRILQAQPYLTDEVLIELTKPANQLTGVDINVLLTRSQNLHESVLLAVLDNPEIGLQDVADIFARQTNYSQAVAGRIISRFTPELEFQTTALLGTNKYLSAQTLESLVNLVPQFSFRSLNAVLAGQENVLSQVQLEQLVSKVTVANSSDYFQLITAQSGKLTATIRNVLAGTGVNVPNIPTPDLPGLPLPACNYVAGIATVSHQVINEYAYYDAISTGHTNSPGYRKLLGVTDPSQVIHLKHSPSWNLYSKKTYSPQLPGKYVKEEHYYYYDLPNLYDQRSIASYKNQGRFKYDHTETLGEGELIDVIEDASVDNEKVKQLFQFHPVIRRILLTQNRILEYEKTVETKLGEGPAIRNSEYFDYDMEFRVSEDEQAETVTDDSYRGTSACPQGSPTSDPPRPGRYGGVKGPIPIRGEETECRNGAIPKKEYLDGLFRFDDDYDYFIVKNDPYYQTRTMLEVRVCPVNLFDTAGSEYKFLYKSTKNITNVALPGVATYLNNTIWLRQKAIKIDTVVTTSDPFNLYREVPEDPNPVMSFQFVKLLPFNVYSAYPMFPYGSVITHRVIHRNRYGQPLEELTDGIRVRYKYDKPVIVYKKDLVRPCNSYITTIEYAIGLPISVTYGPGQDDSLTFRYEYDNRNNVKKVTDANGNEMVYSYDRFNRPYQVKENGKLLSESSYGFYNGGVHTSQSYLNRIPWNYIENKIYTAQDTGMVSRKFFEPNGSVYNQLSTEIRPYQANQYTRVNSGNTEYDKWNRTIKSYQPFGTVSTSAMSVTAPQFITTQPAMESTFEKNGWNRPLRTANYGRNITFGPVVRNAYTSIGGDLLKCELQLNQTEINTIVPGLTNAMIFLRSQTTDEDGKVVYTYQNAIGQQVATRQVNGTNNVITLFGYDSYGNQTLVINPLKHQTRTWFNMQGLPYQIENPDGGVKKLMYDTLGRVILEQDARLAAGATDPDNGFTVLQYKQNRYDHLGRLIEERQISPLVYKTGSTSVLMMAALPSDVMPYRNVTSADLTSSGSFPVPAGAGHIFTNSSTYYELAKFYYPQAKPNPASPTPIFELVNPVSPAQVLGQNKAYPLRKYFYHAATVPNSKLAANGAFLFNNQQRNYKGKLRSVISYPPFENKIADGTGFKYTQQELYSYNTDGTLVWEYKQSNPSGLTGTATDYAVRIDYPKYNYQKQLLEQIVDINNDNRIEFRSTYRYDGWGNLKKVAYGLGTTVKEIADFDYDLANKLLTRKRHLAANGVVDNINYTYDVQLRQTGMTSWGFDYTMYYDQNNPALGVLPTNNYNGNINAVAAYYHLPQTALINADLPIPINVVQSPPPALPSRLVSTYAYDGLNRLTRSNYNLDPGVQGSTVLGINSARSSYTYDAAGNFTGQTYQWAETKFVQLQMKTTSEVANQNFSYETGTNRLSRLTQSRGLSPNPIVYNFTHDGNGNMLTHQKRGITGILYSENLPHRLINGSGKSWYTYNTSGKRTYKEVRNTNNQLVNKEYYLYDMSGNTLAVYDSLDGSYQWYINAGQKIASVSTTSGQQSKLGTAPTATLNSNSFTNGVPVYVNAGTLTVLPVYAVQDHLASTRLSYTATIDATDKITYNVMTMRDYLPFGRTFREYLKGAQDKYQFTGYERDAESGLDNALARMYDSDLGRFLNVDPLMGKFPNMSPFNYCFNNPVGHTDPTGMAPPTEYRAPDGRVLGNIGPGNDVRIINPAYFSPDANGNYNKAELDANSANLDIQPNAASVVNQIETSSSTKVGGKYLEYGAPILLTSTSNADMAITSATLGFGAVFTSGKTESVNLTGTKELPANMNGMLKGTIMQGNSVVIGFAHGHTPNMVSGLSTTTNSQGGNDVDFSKNFRIPNYAIDHNNIHRADPNGTPNNGLSRSLDVLQDALKFR
ncbi:MAG: RHS repeat-associated core domain-containing protein [Bacteroidota bacterium]